MQRPSSGSLMTPTEPGAKTVALLPSSSAPSLTVSLSNRHKSYCWSKGRWSHNGNSSLSRNSRRSGQSTDQPGHCQSPSCRPASGKPWRCQSFQARNSYHESRTYTASHREQVGRALQCNYPTGQTDWVQMVSGTGLRR